MDGMGHNCEQRQILHDKCRHARHDTHNIQYPVIWDGAGGKVAPPSCPDRAPIPDIMGVQNRVLLSSAHCECCRCVKYEDLSKHWLGISRWPNFQFSLGHILAELKSITYIKVYSCSTYQSGYKYHTGSWEGVMTNRNMAPRPVQRLAAGVVRCVAECLHSWRSVTGAADLYTAAAVQQQLFTLNILTQEFYKLAQQFINKTFLRFNWSLLLVVKLWHCGTITGVWKVNKLVRIFKPIWNLA